MKIKMTCSMVSGNFSLNAGEETERFDNDEAIRIIEAGFAVPVDQKPIERAVKKPAEEKRA